LCDGDDNDCDALTDENDAIDAPLWYRDQDSDFYGNPSAPFAACDLPNGYVANALDCNDAATSIHPGALEIAGDSIDQDCDAVDLCFVDSDDDGYGVNSTVLGLTMSCTNDAGRAINAADCNDQSVAIHPGATELVADGADQDCDTVDSCYLDNDNDGHGTTSVVDGLSLDCTLDPLRSAVNDDCNDASASVMPGAVEVVADGIDQDCNSKDDCYLDNDNDGYGTTSVVQGLSLSCFNDAQRATVNTDCDDTDSALRPNASEVPTDGIDQNCNLVDSCYQDNDNDGYGTGIVVDGSSLDCVADAQRASVASDCNDNTNTVHPNRPESIADGVDRTATTSILAIPTPTMMGMEPLSWSMV